MIALDTILKNIRDWELWDISKTFYTDGKTGWENKPKQRTLYPALEFT